MKGKGRRERQTRGTEKRRETRTEGSRKKKKRRKETVKNLLRTPEGLRQ